MMQQFCFHLNIYRGTYVRFLLTLIKFIHITEKYYATEDVNNLKSTADV